MSDTARSKGWWHTLPGVITSLTAAITALAGLIVAINQTGWFSSEPPPAITAPTIATPAAPPGPAAPPARDPLPATPPALTARLAYAVELPAMRDYRLGAATFTLLNAEVSRRTAEKDALQIRLRMTNHDRFDANFWDQSFRLIVGGVPMAPESALNELVRAESAEEGDVLFAMPQGTSEGMLRITHADESTEIPLALGPPR